MRLPFVRPSFTKPRQSNDNSALPLRYPCACSQSPHTPKRRTHMEICQPVVLRVRGLFLLASFVFSGTSLALAASSFIGPLNNVTTLSTTIPSNGDLNPYGVAQVPVTKGSLVAGDFLISNFNNGMNQQGTGTTIVEISP